MNDNPAQPFRPSPRSTAGMRPAWFLLLGILLCLCGVFALAAPILWTFAATLLVGIASILAGIAQAIHAVRMKTWSGSFLCFAIGAAYVLMGVVMWLNPVAGALAITIVLALLLLMAGAGEIALAGSMRKRSGWAWLLFSGIIALLGSIWLLFRLPTAGLFVPGVALGVALLSEGIAFVAIGLRRDEPLDPPSGPVEAESSEAASPAEPRASTDDGERGAL